MRTHRPLQDPCHVEALFRQHYVPLCQHAYTFVQCAATSEEIVQAVFLSLFANEMALHRGVSVQEYLREAVRNRCLRLLKNKWENATMGKDEPVTPPCRNIDSLRKQPNYPALVQFVQREVTRLPEKPRIVFTLFRYAGLSRQEIAAALGISVQTVEVQIATALTRLGAGLP